MNNSLYIHQNDDTTFSAFADKTEHEMHGLTGSLSDLWLRALELFIPDDFDGDKDFEIPVFKFEELQYRTNYFDITYNEDIEGYTMIFNDGNWTYIKINKPEKKNAMLTVEKHGLNEEQDDMLEKFLSEVTQLQAHHGS